MNPKDTKSSSPKATHYEVSPDTDSTLNQPLLPGSESSGEPKRARPGEAIMKSDDPSTAALRAWAEDKQMQVPGANGSFVLGQLSMGAGAVSGGPMFLPRKEFIVEPPHHSTDHGPVKILQDEEGEGKDGEGKKRRRSIVDLFKRKGSRGSGSEAEANKDVAKRVEDGVDEGKQE